MPKPKYTYEQVLYVREQMQKGVPIAEIQKVVPMSGTRMSHIKAGAVRVKR